MDLIFYTFMWIKSRSLLKATFLDVFEWERGWTQRFGLWGLDIDTQKRIRRPSVDFYAEICKENGISSDMVQKYCPEVFDKIFPS